VYLLDEYDVKYLNMEDHNLLTVSISY